MKKQTCST